MSRLMLIVFPNLAEKHSDRIREAAEKHGFQVLFFQKASQALPYTGDAEVILGGNPVLSQNAPNLQWFTSRFAGTDPFMAPDAFANPSAVLTSSSGAYGLTISEHVVMVILEILRRQHEYWQHLQKREWVRRLPVRSIYGSRITLLGTGDIGQYTVQRLRGFEPAQMVGVNRGGKNPGSMFDRVLKSENLDQILPETDILIISLPGTEATFHIVSEKQLKLLPDDAVVINVGRGSVVDQNALEKELRSGRLYAGLDVFEEEPVPPESSLWDCPRLIITPHVSGDLTLPYTVEKIVSQFLENLERYCAGEPLLRVVDRKAGY